MTRSGASGTSHSGGGEDSPPGAPFAAPGFARALSWLARGLVAGLALFALGGAVSAPKAALGPLVSRCHAPAELTRFADPLARSQDRLRRKHRLTVVALGSSSTFGFGASAPSRNYPSLLGRSLAHLYPEATIRVVNRGVNGEDAAQMLARFEKDVMAERPDLVVWQIGSNAIVREIPVEAFRTFVEEGIRRLKAARIDVVLMNPQYTPQLMGEPLHAAYLAMIDQVAAEAQVPVFERYALMRHWLDSAQVTRAELWNADRLHMGDVGYRCVGEQLALSIAAASR
jgi:lysophospholipase L1-like esterase